jgi:hypothetical protein
MEYCLLKCSRIKRSHFQCFKSANETNLASVGSSTSIACGKFMGTIKLALVAFISLMRWYSLPLPLMINCTPNSSPTLSAEDHSIYRCFQKSVARIGYPKMPVTKG